MLNSKSARTGSRRPPTPEDTLRRRVRLYRQAAGLSQAELAAEVNKLGGSMHQTTIAKIEGKGAEKPRDVTVTEFLLLAAALNVPPPLLLFPVGEEDRVQVTRRSRIHPHLAALWFTAHGPLATTERLAVGTEVWQDHMEPLRLYAELDERQSNVQEVTSAIRRAEFTEDKAALGEARQRLAVALTEMHTHLRRMLEAGVRPPALPQEWLDGMNQLGLDTVGLRPMKEGK